MKTNSPVAIMALLAEMARCLNQNLRKVSCAPIDPALTGALTTAAAAEPKTNS